jgi:uncharacterized protein YigA (DUF484 family)
MNSTTFPQPITEDDIANYLGSTPEFFERHAELLAAVHLNSPHNNRSVSLQERQAEMLRDKIRALEHRIMDMVRNGTENTILSDKLLHWACELFQVQDTAALPAHIVSGIQTRFQVPQAGIRIWGAALAWAEADFAQGISDDAKLFAASLAEPFCGVNAGLEVAQWLEQPKEAKSIALLPLRWRGPEQGLEVFGLLVLASPDAQRFTSTMGTDFLERVAELASAALVRLK